MIGCMPQSQGISIVLDPDLVDAYLDEHDLGEGNYNVEIEAALLQRFGTKAGLPAVMLVVEVAGQKYVAKMTMRMFEAISAAAHAAVVKIDADIEAGSYKQKN